MERKSARHQRRTLNESPSEKEGKSLALVEAEVARIPQ